MAVESSPAFLQANSYSAEVTRRAIYSPSFLRNASGNIGSVTGGVLGIGADLINSFPGSGMSVNTSTGEAVVGGSSVTTQSGYYFRNSSTTNTAIAASNPSNPRIDLVCCTVNDAQYTGALNTGIIQVVTGTPTSGATLSNLNGAPALPTSSLLLGYILVAANETNAISGSLNNIPTYLSFAPNSFLAVAASGSGTVTALSGRHYIVSSGNTPFTLPAPFPGARVKVTNYGSGTAVVSHNASEVIYGPGQGASGASTMNVGPYGTSRTYESDGTSWYETGASSGAVGSVSSSGTANTTLPSNTPTKIQIAGTNTDTASLGVGTWLITMGATVQFDGTANAVITITAAVDTATATLTGKYAAQGKDAVGTAGEQMDLNVAFIAVVTAVGNLKLTGNTTGAGNAFALGGTAGFVGYTATQIA